MHSCKQILMQISSLMIHFSCVAHLSQVRFSEMTASVRQHALRIAKETIRFQEFGFALGVKLFFTSGLKQAHREKAVFERIAQYYS